MAGLDKPIVVVGAGLGGLAAACVAAARGHKVIALDKNEWLGGKAAVLQAEGFRFDMGPTILTVPKVLERVFAEGGEKIEDWLDLIRLDPQWRCFFGEGDVLDLVEDVGAMGASAAQFARQARTGRRLRQVHRFFEASAQCLGAILLLEGGREPARHARP